MTVYQYMYPMYPYVCTVMCYEQTTNAPLKCLYLMYVFCSMMEWTTMKTKVEEDEQQNYKQASTKANLTVTHAQTQDG